VQTLHSLKSRRDAEEGFTLIELMVVVLIIAILIAIAIPTFLGARQRAQDRAAQSDLRNGLTAEKTFYTDSEEYSSDVAANGALDSIEPSLQWGATLASGDVVVSVGDVVAANDDNAIVCVQKNSKSGATFSLADIAVGANAGTYYNRGNCSTAVATLTASPWVTSGW
jgi:type IV pilus assembly protein PilA